MTDSLISSFHQSLLLGQLDPSQWSNWLIVVLQVALGLGTVIFVHELGHFAVAKMCGVKCEKFMIGFDIGGYKLSRKWGETEYGIGILPLGGYVKMLGQDDNPANIAEQVRESQASGAAGNISTKMITGPDGQQYEVDSRSYLAKSVPQRMAIISAGVIMNIIFAFIFAVIAFGLGVPYTPSIVRATSPGSPSWEAGLQPGDEIIRAGKFKNPSFEELSSSVILGDMENGVEFEVRRGDEVRQLTLKPRKIDGKLAKIGVAPPASLELAKTVSGSPVSAGSPADKADPKFQPGDLVVAVDGEAVETYVEYLSILSQRADKAITITVERGAKPPEDDPTGKPVGGELVKIDVPANPMRELGLVMRMGRITAVQEGSPAAREEKVSSDDLEPIIQQGDFLESITDATDAPLPGGPSSEQVDWDPMTLPLVLQQLADERSEVKLKLRREDASSAGRKPTKTPIVTLRPVSWQEESFSVNSPVAVPSLGIAYQVLNRVATVVPEGAAADAEGDEIEAGDTIIAAVFIYPDSIPQDEVPKLEARTVPFNDKNGHNWPALMSTLQSTPEGTKVALSFKRGDKILKTIITPVHSKEFFEPSRGLVFNGKQRIRIAETFGEQIQRGYRETVNALGMVYRFLSKLISGQVPVTALGGPLTIFNAATAYAFSGVGKLLVFLTMLSANLAVINFLPIPLLDGGHMVFLGYEGLRGRPASERIVVAMHTIGFVAIISLMIFVLSLDFKIIPRNL